MSSQKKIIPYTSSSFDFQKTRLKQKLVQIGIDITDDEATSITFLSRRKYDRYDHLPSGETFYIRLIQWLRSNFRKNERQTAFEIVKSLKFIDEHELKELTISSFENIKRHLLIDKNNIDTSNWYSYMDVKKEVIEEKLSKTIFVACTDDIKFDFFRRYAMRANPKSFKKDNFIEYYKTNKNSMNDLPEYDRIVLIDQLSASGTTVIRTEKNKETGNEYWTGKIPRFFEIWNDFLNMKNIYYCPYILSYVAKNNITKRLKDWAKENSISNEINIIETCNIPISQCISNKNSTDIDETTPVAKLCKKYYKYFIDDEHTLKVGGVPYGYGRAGLTLVIQSNCPNNSLPILWHSFNDWYPLFPRVSHHR